MKQLICILFGAFLFGACVGEARPIRSTTIVRTIRADSEDDIISLRVPVSMLNLGLTYRHEDKNVHASISPMSLTNTGEDCSSMTVFVNESSIWLRLSQSVELHRRGVVYEFYIPLSYAPYFSYITHTVKLDICGTQFFLNREQIKQIGDFVDAALLWNNTLR